MIFKLILRELKSSPKFVLIFILNIFIGLSGLSIIESFKGSFVRELETNSRKILGADLALSSRIDITEEKVNKVQNILADSVMAKNVGLFSMASANKSTRLVSVKVLDLNFPFYGKITLKNGVPFSFENHNEAYVYPEVLIQLKSKIGDLIEVGESKFTIKGVIEDDGQQSFQMGSIAPRVYISKKALENAKLLQKGSTATYSYFFKLKSTISDSLRKEVIKALDDSSIQVLTPKKSSQQVGRIIKYLNDFLGLVSLSGLFLALMGLMYLFRSFLFKRRKEISICQFLGISNKDIILIYSGQLLLMSLIGASLSAIVTPLALPLVLDQFNSLLEVNLAFKLSLESLVAPFVIGTLGALLIGLPLILPYTKSNYRNLFSHEDDDISRSSNWFYFIPAFVFFYVTSIYLCKSVIIGSIFSVILAISILLIFSVGHFALIRFHKLSKKGSLENKLVWGFITRFKSSTLFIFATLMISSMMMTIIPQVKDVLLNEVERPLKEDGPSAFLFDIQTEQVEQLESFISDVGAKKLVMSPMVRSRLMKINGERVKTSIAESMTREQEREVRMRNRGVNLSYRDNLDESEKLVEGVLPSGVYDFEKNEFAEVTLEKRYASRLGVGVGDTLDFDILGINVPTKIVGLREVKWTSFRPNFFILFQKGVLEDAPKTYLSAIRTTDSSDDDSFQTSLFTKFPNVSYVDIRRAISKVKVIMNNMSLILKSMSFLVLVVGLMVLFSIISHQIVLRRANINLLKVLGLSKARLTRVVLKEFFYISSLGTLIGISFSTLICVLLSYFIFDTSFIINFETIIVPIILIPLASIIISFLGTQKVLNSSASKVFSEIS